jgi:hypothetical protein
MMGAHRKSAEILKIAGAFEKNPQRAREDMPGAGPLDHTPPESFTEPQLIAWLEVMNELPRMAITQSERQAVVQMAKIRAALHPMEATDPQFLKLDDALRQWSVQMGMTLQARIKMGSSGQNTKPQKFQQLADAKSA